MALEPFVVTVGGAASPSTRCATPRWAITITGAEDVHHRRCDTTIKRARTDTAFWHRQPSPSASGLVTVAYTSAASSDPATTVGAAGHVPRVCVATFASHNGPAVPTAGRAVL